MILRNSSKKILLVTGLFLTGMTVLAQNSSRPSYADNGFVISTLVSNQAQYDMSQLAQHKSTSDDVQQFSEHMITIHDQIEGQFKSYLKTFDLSEPKKPSKQEKQEMAKLETLSGDAFDTEYLQAMAKQQQHWLKGFQDESQSSYQYLQKLTTSDLPILTQNFTVLQQIAKAHNVTLESNK